MDSKSEKLHNLRHSLAHILASAVTEMFPKAQLGVGPVIENGFFYDFLLPRPLTPEDLKKLEKRMRELVKQKLPFERNEMPIADAKKYFKEANQPFKVQLIEDIEKFGTTKADEILSQGGERREDKGNTSKRSDAVPSRNSLPPTVSLYKTGRFTDLCRGGHVATTSEIDPQSFKLDKISGAYWRGDQKNPQMQRIYGLAFESKEELENYVRLQEEIIKRDHRVLGPKLGLFLFNDMAPGIPFYQPKGMIVRNELEKFVREVSYGPGYSEVRLPQMFDSELWKISGHWEHYKDDMFVFDVENRKFALKPMNCPGHMLLYKQGLYSYKDLPLRFAEMTTLHRNELTGALSGLTRTRAFAQDDCHIFLTQDQIEKEVVELLARTKRIFDTFGMEIEDVVVSTRPDQALGTKKEWDEAEKSLEAALKKAKWKYAINPKDGAFYGPKIDMRIRDVLGRKWQLATIQLDFQMPQRFGLEYVDAHGQKQTPIVIHRALLGSFERFLGIMIEHFAGALPVWLAPVQVKILPITDKQNKYALALAVDLAAEQIRVEADDRSESVGKKIREAEMEKVPYMLIVGEKEAKAKTISVRSRNKDLGSMKLQKFIDKIQDQISKRSL
ncbi:MAG TPA: threonine--tRNA ligase [Patescibacteria group bacterium]|nr:threonine--tRNA ligase [Patescibacteria group bacterium]